MRFRIQEEIPRRTNNDLDRITLAIIGAIKYYRVRKFVFNELAGDTFATTIGQESYSNATTEGAGLGYDDDLFGINAIYAELAGNRWVPVDEWPFDIVRLWNVSDSTTGYPDFYAWYANKIYLSPPPHVVYNLRIDGIQDIGTPTAQAVGGVWTFLEPDGSALTDSYTNAWFTEGEELIRLHAKVDLAQNVFRDDRESGRLSQREQAVLGQLLERGRAYRSNMKVVPYY